MPTSTPASVCRANRSTGSVRSSARACAVDNLSVAAACLLGWLEIVSISRVGPGVSDDNRSRSVIDVPSRDTLQLLNGLRPSW
jgi:hypothetical protein